MIFSVSFVNASDTSTNDVDTNESMILSTVPEENILAENTEIISNEDSSSIGQTDESQNTGETEKSDQAQILSANNDEYLADELEILAAVDDGCLDDETQILAAVDDGYFANENQILSGPNDEYLGPGKTVGDIITAMQTVSNRGGGTVYLQGNSFSGSYAGGRNLRISNVNVVGGSESNPNLRAKFTDAGYNFIFQNANFNNVNFKNIDVNGQFMWFQEGGSYTNSHITQCTSVNQFICCVGHNHIPFHLINVNFTYCNQTYSDVDGKPSDGNGQFGAMMGCEIRDCNFINTTSGHHGGALCVSDRSDWGPGVISNGVITTTITNTNFINITSAWFAIYLHSSFKDYEYLTLPSPEIVENCKFINCVATEDYGACIGISQDGTIVKNCEFINNTGGQGTAIMVGGISKDKNTIDDISFAGNNIEGNNVTIQDCYFENNLAYEHDCHFPPYSKGASGNGGAIFVKGDNTTIIGCNFTKNTAEYGNGAAVYIEGSGTNVTNSRFYYHESDDGAVYIKGNNTTIRGSTFDYNYAYDSAASVYIEGNDTAIADSIFEHNEAFYHGAAVYIEGSRTKISGSNFTDNDALFGAAVYVKGLETKISDSNFTDNEAVQGAGVYIEGNKTVISDSNFIVNKATSDGAGAYIHGDNTVFYDSGFANNTARNGGGIYVRGRNTIVNGSDFKGNNVTYQGGAVYVDGSNTDFNNNNFTNNEAVPHDSSEYSGLGGAVFVIGNNTLTTNNDFEHNKARNGSALYSTGNNLTVINDIYRENQAWSYVLLTVAEPDISLYNTSDIEIEVVHYGGDNMLNAIHNNASHDQIRLKNVTYVNSYGKELHTLENEFEYPVDGVEMSEAGTKLYQDDREYHQLLHINVTDEEGNLIYNTTNITTNLYGDIYVTLPKSKLGVGRYTVSALHPDDWNYKEIRNYTTFEIFDHVDLEITKTSDKGEYFDDDIAIWTITVKSAANGTNATNVIVDDILPSDFEFINCTTDNGTYNSHTGIWTIGFMGNGTEATLVIYALVESDIERLDHIVHIDCEEKNVDMSIDRVVSPEKDRYDEGDLATWTITVTNNGDYTIHDVVLIHSFPFEFELEPHTVPDASQGTYDDRNHTWIIGDMVSGQVSTIEIISRATINVTHITNLMELDYREKHLNLTVNKSSDKEEYHDGEEATITITVHNGEGCEATNVVLNDILQHEFEYKSHEGSGYDPDTNVWTVGNMGLNSDAQLVIKTTATRLYGDVTNVAVVTCNEAEWDETNNVAERTVRVVPLPEPKKTVSNITPNYYDEVEYNLTINNTGNFPYEKNLTVIDSLPDGLEYIGLVNLIGAKPLGFKQEGNKLIWNITSINPGVPAIITIKVRVVGLGDLITNKTFIDNVTGRNDIAYIGNLTNNLTLIGPNGTERTVSRTVYPVPITDLSVDIVSDKDEYFVDDVATWTITVHNAGNGTNATYVNLTDLFDDDFHDNFVIIGWTTGNGTYDNATGTWTIGNMTNGTDAVLEIKSLA
ncbi:right-handed parallel beta-helix repeat-containing protein, partial [Methanobrevibacter sp.]|uniref:right-handed parallel beta-helix repeat-containing protein n=1 Tax=Methanobrevibacter sp. TaxID=66852 RepID=UPI00388F0E51